MLGTILSRAVVGASPFWATVAAAAALVAMHRLVALMAMRWPWFDAWISGHIRELVMDGHINQPAMRKALVNGNDLEQAVRQKSGRENLAEIQRAVLERDGSITVALRRRHTEPPG